MKKEVFLSRSPEETESIGARLASTLAAGDCVGLVGELGSGKTCLVRGMSAGLGRKGAVRSPSFAIMNVYGKVGGRQGRQLYHMDLYRLRTEEEFYGAGLDEYICGSGISVIEWADKLPSLIRECTHLVRFRYGKLENERLIEIERL